VRRLGLKLDSSSCLGGVGRRGTRRVELEGDVDARVSGAAFNAVITIISGTPRAGDGPLGASAHLGKVGASLA
jgi:hypothetical protein